MSLRVKIASAILFIVVTLAGYYPGFTIGKQVAISGMLVVMSLGILLVIVTDINIWLKLFLLSSLPTIIYSKNPVVSAVCLGGVVFYIWIYYFLTKFKKEEIIDLLKVVVVLVGIQAIWVLLAAININHNHGIIYRNINTCGTIGYVNMVALLLSSTLPLTILYRKNMILPVMAAWWVCKSMTSIGALIVSIGIFIFKKSKLFIVTAIIAVIFLGCIGIPKWRECIRKDVWDVVIYEIKKTPVFGIGFGMFKLYPLAQKEEGSKKVVMHAHNAYLELAREGGLVCTLSIIGFIISLFIKFFRSDKTLEQRAVFGAFCGFLLGMIFSFPDRNIQMMSFFLIIVASLTVLLKEGKPCLLNAPTLQESKLFMWVTQLMSSMKRIILQ